MVLVIIYRQITNMDRSYNFMRDMLMYFDKAVLKELLIMLLNGMILPIKNAHVVKKYTNK